MKIAFLLFIIALSLQPLKSEGNKNVFSLDRLELNDSQKEKIKDFEVISNSDVEDLDEGKNQKLHYKIMGLHKRSCMIALAKLSLYEKYSEFLDVVSQSDYSEEDKRFKLKLESSLLPFSMKLDFKIERITSPGLYRFEFDKGFLKNLVGEIHISSYKNHCFFYSEVNWKGPHSEINSTVFEVFTQTLGELAMKKLFRISSTL